MKALGEAVESALAVVVMLGSAGLSQVAMAPTVARGQSTSQSKQIAEGGR